MTTIKKVFELIKLDEFDVGHLAQFAVKELVVSIDWAPKSIKLYVGKANINLETLFALALPEMIKTLIDGKNNPYVIVQAIIYKNTFDAHYGFEIIPGLGSYPITVSEETIAKLMSFFTVSIFLSGSSMPKNDASGQKFVTDFFSWIDPEVSDCLHFKRKVLGGMDPVINWAIMYKAILPNLGGPFLNRLTLQSAGSKVFSIILTLIEEGLVTETNTVAPGEKTLIRQLIDKFKGKGFIKNEKLTVVFADFAVLPGIKPPSVNLSIELLKLCRNAIHSRLTRFKVKLFGNRTNYDHSKEWLALTTDLPKDVSAMSNITNAVLVNLTRVVPARDNLDTACMEERRESFANYGYTSFRCGPPLVNA